MAGFTGGNGTVFHYNGSDASLDPMTESGWTLVRSTYAPIRAVWGTGPTDIWFVGGSGIYHLGLP